MNKFAKINMAKSIIESFKCVVNNSFHKIEPQNKINLQENNI